MEYLLGIDNGGTVTKAALYDSSGREIAISRIDTKVISEKAGFTEINMDDMKGSIFRVIRDLLYSSKVRGDEIAGIACCGHGKGLYLVDEAGKPVCNGILSTDNRALEYVALFEKTLDMDAIYAKTYQAVVPSQPVCLLAWMKDNKPELIAKIKWIFACKDYIRFLLTGIPYAEISDYSGSNLVNLNTKSFDKELLAEFGLEEFYPCLPPLKSATDFCGGITKEVAKLTNLKAGTPVFGGMFDINACSIASGVVDPTSISMIAGTWSINTYLSKEPVKGRQVMMNSIFCDGEHYLAEESSATSAGNLAWYIKTLLPELKTQSKQSIYAITDEWVTELKDEEDYPYYFPFIMASNVHPKAKASLMGMTYYHTRKHLTKSIYEGVAFSHLHHYKNLMASSSGEFDSIRLSGGVANSDIWLSMFADVLGEEITVVETKEAGALGCAITVAVAIGRYSSYQEACSAMVKIQKVVKPDMERHQVYAKRFAQYSKMLDALESVWE
ncbi:MAG: FGGY-family carbohydrate kinase [Sphaerochaeta sp.]|nr:FGGY-family carbohydrate kinase [Sphaerochaeta sp.]